MWALLAASVVFWGLRVAVASPTALPDVRTAAVNVPGAGTLEKVLGAPAADPDEEEVPEAPAASSRFLLLGVMSPPGGARYGGLALIGMDGKPARPWRTGALHDGWTLTSVNKREAVLTPLGGGAPVTLTLPDPATARANAGRPTGPVAGTARPGMNLPGMPGMVVSPGQPGPGGPNGAMQPRPGQPPVPAQAPQVAEEDDE